jgi:hypothetical protein
LITLKVPVSTCWLSTMCLISKSEAGKVELEVGHLRAVLGEVANMLMTRAEKIWQSGTTACQARWAMKLALNSATHYANNAIKFTERARCAPVSTTARV